MMKHIAILVLKLFGWSVNQTVPPEAMRSVMIAAPHTTNWDFILTRVAFFVLGIPVKIAVKNFWTKFPFGLFIIPFGGLGIDRSPKNPNKPRPSQIEQMASYFAEYDKIAMVIAPEGSRSLRKEWKMGFYYVAQKAQVPITFGYLDYAKKEAGVGGAVHLTEDMASDLQKVMHFYKTIAPKFPEKFSVDQRYD